MLRPTYPAPATVICFIVRTLYLYIANAKRVKILCWEGYFFEKGKKRMKIQMKFGHSENSVYLCTFKQERESDDHERENT